MILGVVTDYFEQRAQRYLWWVHAEYFLGGFGNCLSCQIGNKSFEIKFIVKIYCIYIEQIEKKYEKIIVQNVKKNFDYGH